MSELDNNTIKRENMTAYIVFCICFAIGSFIFYKRTGNVTWAIVLFLVCVVILCFYSRILQLEDEAALIAAEEEEYEKEEYEEEYVDDTEYRRNTFLKNLDAFKKEAKEKYDDTAMQLGKPMECLSDDEIDVWLVDGRIISMLKWKTIEKEIEDFEGEYADMIIEGMSGRNIDFEYGLERYKNMTKYGSDGIQHAFVKEEEDVQVQEDEIEECEYEEVYEEEPKEIEKKENHLIAQIFEKLVEQ